GVTNNCASCHNGVSATGMPPTHIPVGTPPTPCEGCHSTTNFTSFAGTKINHLAVTALTCASCHETANYLGMRPSTNATAGDSRPPTALDPIHPAKSAGDCSTCHDTVTFAGSAVRPPNHIPTSAPCAQCHTTAGVYALYSVTGTHQGVSGCLTCHGPTVGPFANVTIVITTANHIPTSAPCAQCHTTAGDNALYSVTGTHQGVTGCLTCHGSTVAGTFANITIVSNPSNHMPIGNLDCNGSGCHTTTNVNAGGFK